MSRLTHKRGYAFRAAAFAAVAIASALPATPGTASAAAASGADGAFVPVRDEAAKLHALVRWDRGSGAVVVTASGSTLILTPGRTSATLNGEEVELDASPRTERYRTLVPAGLLGKLLGQAEARGAETGTGTERGTGTETGMGTDSEKEQAKTASVNGTETETAANDAAEPFLRALSKGDGETALRYASGEFKRAVPPSRLDTLWATYAQAYGRTTKLLSETTSRNAVHDNVTFTYRTEKSPLAFTIRLNPEGEVDDLYVQPSPSSAYSAPAYDQPSAYTEEEVTVGDGPFALPGTLTKPTNGEGPFPVVVLVHGSGTNDRDESLYGAKPFRDLAVGLAARGIASLRYDKVTYEHTLKIGSDPRLTLKRETVDDALAAVRLLANRADIDAARIFVAGHSQGGFAMPLIVKNDTDGAIRGTILLAGPSGRFADVLVDQQEELLRRASELGQDPAPYEQHVAQVKAVAEMVDDPRYSVDRLPANFPPGSPYWWYEQRSYVPVELAKRQSGPMLVLQGKNDWQVPLDQFEAWKSGLANRTDVTFKSYPDVTHLLSEYDGVSTGAEYARPSNVSPAIIDDIAAWIKKVD